MADRTPPTATSSSELLAVRGGLSQPAGEHHVALGGHPLHLVEEDVAVGGVRSAMNVENQWVLLPGREAYRLQDPRLDLLAVEARVPEVLGRDELALREERVVDVGELGEMLGLRVERVYVGEVSRVADRQGKVAAVGRGGVAEDGVVSGGQRLSRPGLCVVPDEIRAAVLGRGDDHR